MESEFERYQYTSVCSSVIACQRKKEGEERGVKWSNLLLLFFFFSSFLFDPDPYSRCLTPFSALAKRASLSPSPYRRMFKQPRNCSACRKKKVLREAWIAAGETNQKKIPHKVFFFGASLLLGPL